MSKEISYKQTQLNDITPRIASFDNQRRHRSHQPSVNKNVRRRKQSFSNSSKILKEAIPELNGEESGTFVTVPKNSVSQSMFITQNDSPIEPKPKRSKPPPKIQEEIQMFNPAPVKTNKEIQMSNPAPVKANKEIENVKPIVKAAVDETNSVISNLSQKSIKSRRIRTPRDTEKTSSTSSFVPKPPSIANILKEPSITKINETPPISPERTLPTETPSQVEIPVIQTTTEPAKSPSPELKPVEVAMRPGRMRPTSFFNEDPKPVQDRPRMLSENPQKLPYADPFAEKPQVQPFADPFEQKPQQKPFADPFSSINTSPSNDLFSVKPKRQISDVTNDNFDSFFKPKISPAMSNTNIARPAIQPMAAPAKPMQQAVEIEDLSYSRPAMQPMAPSKPKFQAMEIEDLSCEDLL